MKNMKYFIGSNALVRSSLASFLASKHHQELKMIPGLSSLIVDKDIYIGLGILFFIG
jgi:hypothetical protein